MNEKNPRYNRITPPVLYKKEIYADTWFYQITDDVPVIHIFEVHRLLPNRDVINYLINFFGPYRLIRVWIDE